MLTSIGLLFLALTQGHVSHQQVLVNTDQYIVICTAKANTRYMATLHALAFAECVENAQAVGYK